MKKITVRSGSDKSSSRLSKSEYVIRPESRGHSPFGVSSNSILASSLFASDRERVVSSPESGELGTGGGTPRILRLLLARSSLSRLTVHKRSRYAGKLE